MSKIERELEQAQEKLDNTMLSLNQSKLELEAKQKSLKELNKQEKSLQCSIESLKQALSDDDVALSVAQENNKSILSSMDNEKLKLQAELEAIRSFIEEE